ncbi:hypothetical protein R1538_34615 [Rhizobium leguminosarum]|uniref:hypothetical protein n=1 Tax=Rhizobium leguminosarum TaxID=384 RepID=UPI00293DB27D|nr:hypothetical protein [Rhizobium leguminosarum]MDV4166185.1 hypothetical protein [Rhizobium leguminosarum]
MAKTSILDWDTAALGNTDINSIGILGSNIVANFDNAFRELMAQGASNLVSRFTSRAAGYTAVKADHNQVSLFTASATLGLTAAATLTNGWEHIVVASGGEVTIDPNGSETINGLTTIVVLNGQRATIWCNGTAFYASVTGEATIGAAIQGKLYGLTLSNNGSDATNDIDIAVGSAASDGTTPILMTLAAGITKRLDANWAAGTNAGMRYSGAAIANTTYHVYLASTAVGGSTDIYADPSADPAVALAHLQAEAGGSSYAKVRRIGSIIRESAAIVAFKQDGNTFRRATKTDRSSTSAAASALLALGIPTGINVYPLLSIDMATGSVSTDAQTLLGGAWEGSAGIVVSRVFTTSLAGSSSVAHDTIPPVFLSNTSAQIYFAATISSGSISANVLSTVGWIDNRGTV